AQWQEARERMLTALQTEIFGDFPDPSAAHRSHVRSLEGHGARIEHWTLETEPGVTIPVVLCVPNGQTEKEKRPAVLVVDERGKRVAFARGLIERLVSAGYVVAALDYRGTGETAGTVPA